MLHDKEKREDILLRITDKLTRLHKKRILEQIGRKAPNIVSFKPVVVYSSSPVKATDIPLAVDAEPEFGPLVGGSDAKSNFGFEISGVY